ncbi:MAG: dTMP kinase [Caldimonas sp.]
MKGRFITFEGIDGAGKSTHVAPTAEWLRAAGLTVVCTREPGGTPLAERLRELVLHEPMPAISEALLVFAARRDHIERVIGPALGRGDIVVCDRFSDATFAYQGFARGQPIERLAMLEEWVQEGLHPDLTLWFDVEPEIAAARRASARQADRFESEDVAFFARVRAGYESRRRAAPERFVRIDSSLERDTVSTQIRAALGTLLAMPPSH